MSRLCILGAGGHGRVVADTAEASGQWREILFLDDSGPVVPEGWPVVGGFADYPAWMGEGTDFVVALGDSHQRRDWTHRLIEAGCSLATVVHPRAWVSPRAVLGAGSVVLAGAVINTGARLEEAVIVNSGAVVEHDCVLGAGVHVCPNASLAGNVQVAPGSWVGLGSAIRQGVRIGRDALVAAGAVVVNDVAPGQHVCGVPARAMS